MSDRKCPCLDNLSVKLKRHEAIYKDFCKQTELPEFNERLQYAGFNRSVNQKAYNSANKHYKDWSKSIGAESFADSIANYYKKKYNNTNEYALLEQYSHSIKIGELSPLSTFENYISIYNEINTKLVGTSTINGIKITGVSKHYIARSIGCMEKLRSGVTVDNQYKALTSADTKIVVGSNDRQGRGSIKFITNDCIVSVNPETGVLIQTNPQ